MGGDPAPPPASILFLSHLLFLFFLQLCFRCCASRREQQNKEKKETAWSNAQCWLPSAANRKLQSSKRTFTQHGQHRRPTLWLMGEALYNSQWSAVPLGWTLCMLMGNNILCLLEIDNCWVEFLLLLAYFKIAYPFPTLEGGNVHIIFVTLYRPSRGWLNSMVLCYSRRIILWRQCRVYL